MIVTRLSEPAIGYRHFKLADRGRALEAVTSRERWTAELHEARCVGTAHAAPAHGCHCGLHAFGDLATARRWRPTGVSRTVIGAVKLYRAPDRRIIAGELPRDFAGGTGRAVQIRAPYGQLVAILDDGRRARRVAKALGVPALPERDGAGRPQFEAYAREHGAELRPPEGLPDEGPAPAPQQSVAVPVSASPLPVAGRRWTAPAWPSPWRLQWPVVGATVGVVWALLVKERQVGLLALAAYTGAGVPVGWRLLRTTEAMNVYGLALKAALAVVLGFCAVPFALFPGPYMWPATARLLTAALRLLWWAARPAVTAARRALGWVARMAGRWLRRAATRLWRAARGRLAR